MHLVLIRHLPTPLNQQNILQGRYDISIIEPDAGILKQIEENKRVISEMAPNLDLVLTSSLKRTCETATAYGFEDFKIESLLDELDFGRFEGREKGKLIEELGEAWIEDPRQLELGETIHAFEQRIKRFLKKYGELNHLLIFGHGAWIRGLYSIRKFWDLRALNNIHIANNSVTELNF